MVYATAGNLSQRDADRRDAAPAKPSSIASSTDNNATFTVTSEPCKIAAELIDKIFEYGVSDQPEAGAAGNRGQGLFVAKTYMAKMGGTICVRNVADGVDFVLGLQRLRG